MGPAKGDRDQRTVFEAMLSILQKAGCDVLFPSNMEKLCCGVVFESKGFFSQADRKTDELEQELLESSKGGEYPVLCDTSPCLYRMRRAFKSNLRVLEAAEFIHTSLMDRLTFKKIPDTVALHLTCGSAKMGLQEKLRAVAEACAEKVIMPEKVRCCGFAGDRGFYYPELNASALRELKSSLLTDFLSTAAFRISLFYILWTVVRLHNKQSIRKGREWTGKRTKSCRRSPRRKNSASYRP